MLPLEKEAKKKGKAEGGSGSFHLWFAAQGAPEEERASKGKRSRR